MSRLRYKMDKAVRIAGSETLKVAWRLRHGAPAEKRFVFVFGAQRSGTTMLGELLGDSPEIRHYGERSPKAFDQFRLRPLPVIEHLLQSSSQPVMVLKPLMDSHRAAELLQTFPRSKGVWIYRRFEDRVNSSVRTFGEANLRFMRDFAQGRGLDSWAAQGLEDEDFERIRSHNPASMNPESAAALFWFLRNQLFFRQNLGENPDLRLLSYEQLVTDPVSTIRDLCKFLECRHFPRMTARVHAASLGKSPPPPVSPALRDLCTDLYEKLEEIRAAQAAV